MKPHLISTSFSVPTPKIIIPKLFRFPDKAISTPIPIPRNMTKLIVIIGVTGNQGNSVAQRFLQDSNYKVRGITRNTTSAQAQSLSAQGVEIVEADLDDVNSLISAFQGAHLIFSVTNYWEPFFRPDCRQKAQELGISCRKYAYDVEYRQGKNIADAAAHSSVVSGLDANGFIASTLSHAGKSSKGKFTGVYHHDSKADIFPYYVRERYGGEGELAVKMSCVMTGYFTSSYKLAMKSFLGKVCFFVHSSRYHTTFQHRYLIIIASIAERSYRRGKITG